MVLCDADGYAAAAAEVGEPAKHSFSFPRPDELFIDFDEFLAAFARAGGNVLTVQAGAAGEGAGRYSTLIRALFIDAGWFSQ